MEEKVEMLDIEPEVITQKTVNNNPSSVVVNENSNKDFSSKKEEVIDLTLSDSDDEPLMPRKKQIADSSNQLTKTSGKLYLKLLINLVCFYLNAYNGAIFLKIHLC